MIKTTIEWYTLDEKLPFDGKCFSEGQYAEVLCSVEYCIVETFRYLNNQLGIFQYGEWLDYTGDVKYWAYVPEIWVE